jgi:hypothetical protein
MTDTLRVQFRRRCAREIQLRFRESRKESTRD